MSKPVLEEWLAFLNKREWVEPALKDPEWVVVHASEVKEGDYLMIAGSGDKPSSYWNFLDQRKTQGWRVSASGTPLTQLNTYTPEHVANNWPSCHFLVRRSRSISKKDFPHFCPRCKQSAYVGFNVRVIHANGSDNCS